MSNEQEIKELRKQLENLDVLRTVAPNSEAGKMISRLNKLLLEESAKKEASTMEDLRFASEEEALQYLSDVTGKSIRVAVKDDTVRFYTDDGKYRGMENLKKSTFLGLKSWITSGNYITIGEEKIDDYNKLPRNKLK
jgi:hypothetical protein